MTGKDDKDKNDMITVPISFDGINESGPKLNITINELLILVRDNSITLRAHQSRKMVMKKLVEENQR